MKQVAKVYYVPMFLSLVLLVVILGRNPVRADVTPLTELSRASERLAREVGPSVVQILVAGYGPADYTAAGTTPLLRQRASGSGVIVHADGYVITNAHVVEGARKIQVLLARPPAETPAGRSILQPRGKVVGAQLVGLDLETDLAVLRIEEQNLPSLELGNSDGLRQGQVVFALGSPLGLENSLSIGVVSSVARQLGPEEPMIYIQTDAAINPGNSGGPLVNTEGEVVGINTFILSQSGGNEGIGFAAPSNIVNNVYRQLREIGRVHRGVIGVHAQTIEPVLAEALDLPQTWGVVIGDVFPDSPAEKAGLMIGDVILKLNGKPMENGRQFDINLYPIQVGEKASLVIARYEDTFNIQVAVVERPNDFERMSELVNPERNLVPRLGILGIDLDRTIASLLPPLRRREGVVVAAQTDIGPDWGVYFLPGDVIYELNRQTVTDLASLRDMVGSIQPGAATVMQIQRGDQLMYVAFKLD